SVDESVRRSTVFLDPVPTSLSARDPHVVSTLPSLRRVRPACRRPALSLALDRDSPQPGVVIMLKHWRARFVRNFQDPVVRGQVMALMGGKLIGLTLVLTAMSVFIAPVVYGDSGQPTPEINAINTVWTLVAAFLVFGMQVGFVMLESGFARARESVNILVEGIADTCICVILFWAIGFAFMFEPGTPFIGTTGF